MDVTGPVDASKSISAKRKFVQWTWKWFYDNNYQDIQEKPDASKLICLLQSIGFQLKQFEKSENLTDLTGENSLRVTLECGTSKMKATLELNDVNCTCPDSEERKDGSIWSVSATVPTGSSDSINKVEDSGSNLLPKLSKDSRLLINDVLHCLLNTIDSNNFDNKHKSNLNITSDNRKLSTELSDTFIRIRGKTESEIHKSKSRTNNNPTNKYGSQPRLSISRSSTVSVDKLPEIVKTKPSPDEKGKRKSLQRQKTWDLIDMTGIDDRPRSSPTKCSNTPVVMSDLCISLDRISVQSDEENLSIPECLRRAKYYISKVEMSVDCSLNSDSNKLHKMFTKPPPPTRSSTSLRISPANSLRSLKSNTSLSVSPTTSRSDSPSSSSSRLSTKSAVQKLPTRRSTGPTLYSPQPILNKTPMKLPPRGRSIGNPTPALKLAVASARSNTGILKRTNLETTSGNDARKIASPFLNSSSVKAGVSQMKTPGRKTLSSLNFAGNLTQTPGTPGGIVNSSGSGVPIIRKQASSPTTSSQKKIGTLGTPRLILPKK